MAKIKELEEKLQSQQSEVSVVNSLPLFNPVDNLNINNVTTQVTDIIGTLK